MNTKLPKIIFVADIIICTLFFFLIIHNDLRWERPNLFMLSFPLLRMWSSFLIYRKSRLLPVPIVAMLSIMVFTASVIPNYMNAAFCLFVTPWITLFQKTSSLFDVQSIDLTMFQDFVNLMHEQTMTFSIIGCIWLIGIPVIVFIYLMYKKQLKTEGLGILKSFGLCTYLLSAIFIVAIVMSTTNNIGIGAIAFVVSIILIPTLFYRKSLNELLNRDEIFVLIAFAIFAVSYVCALGMEEKSIITTILLPSAFYALVNWYRRRKVPSKDLGFIIAASILFWVSQYTYEVLRIILMLFSLELMAIPVIQYNKTVCNRWASCGLYIIIALIIPVLSIGYNPYSVWDARRVIHYDGYSWAKNGLLVVKSKNGIGIRDRYGIVLPAENSYFEILNPTKPYLKVYRNNSWQIYDIERKELVSDAMFREIVPCDKHVYRLESENSDKYLKIPLYYNRYKKEQPAMITDSIPVKKKETNSVYTDYE